MRSKELRTAKLLKNNDKLIVKGIMIMVIVIKFCGMVVQQMCFSLMLSRDHSMIFLCSQTLRQTLTR